MAPPLFSSSEYCRFYKTKLQTRVRAFKAEISRMPAAISDRSKRRAPSSISCMEDQPQIHRSPSICPNFSKNWWNNRILWTLNSCDYTTAQTVSFVFYPDFANPSSGSRRFCARKAQAARGDCIHRGKVAIHNWVVTVCSCSAKPLWPYIPGMEEEQKNGTKSYVKFDIFRKILCQAPHFWYHSSCVRSKL